MRALALSLTAGLLLSAGSSFAQPYPSMATDERPIGLYLEGGLAAGSSETGGAIGGAFTLDVTDRLGLEVTGGFLDRGPAIDAWSGSASLLVYLLPAGEDVVPFLAAGGGVYRSTVDFGDPRFAGSRGNVPWMYGAGTYGPMYGSAYGSMYGAGYGHGFGMGGHMSSTDPVFPLGGGLRWNASERLSVRASARALVVAAEGEAFTVGLFTVGFGLRF